MAAKPEAVRPSTVHDGTGEQGLAVEPAGRDSSMSKTDASASFAKVSPPPRQPGLWKRLQASGRSQGPHYLVRILAILVGVGLWHLASSNGWNWVLHFENVPKPSVVGEAFVTQLGTDSFYTHILVSLQRILMAYALAAGLGILLGTLMGRSRWIEDVFSPYIEILRPIPAVAWIPMAILIMPTEESSIIFITFLGAFFPIVLNTMHGVEQTPAVLVRAARCLGASNSAIVRHVVLPAALPSIVAGLAIGMGVAWFSLLAGEIISGQYGIGYFTWSAYTLVEYPKIIIGMLAIGGLGTLSTYLVRLCTRPLLRWQSTQGARA